MLEKTIKALLTKKVNEWLGSITDETVRIKARRDLVITGGCIPSMMVNDEPNDYDVYFKTPETVILVANYYANLWKQDNPESSMFVQLNETRDRVTIFKGKKKQTSTEGSPLPQANEELGLNPNEFINAREIDEMQETRKTEAEKRMFHPVFISANAITLSNGIQIICRFFGEPSEIHSTYDFEHTKAYYHMKMEWEKVEGGITEAYQKVARYMELVIPKKVYECVMNKALIYTGSKYPVCSLFRLRKFIGRGWKINAGQILKMSMQVSELDLSDVEILRDQLVGVDSLYFYELIEQIRDMKGKNPHLVIDSMFIMEAVDKLF